VLFISSACSPAVLDAAKPVAGFDRGAPAGEIGEVDQQTYE